MLIYPTQFAEEIFKTLKASEDEACHQIRVLRATNEDRGNMIIPDHRFKTTMGGWFDVIQRFVRASQCCRDVSAYVTINPVHRDLMSRANNDLKRLGKDIKATTEADILCRRWAFLDIDSVRLEAGKPVAGGSATDEEHGRALALRDLILGECPDLAESAIWGSSGNGAWILARLPDSPNDAEHNELVKQFLAIMADRFGAKERGDLAYIDTKTYDDNWIMGIPGTFKCKKDSTKERPWRMVTFDSPEARAPIPLERKAWLERPEWSTFVAQVAAAKAPALAAVLPHKALATIVPLTTRGYPGIDDNRILERASRYVAKIPHAVSGNHGHDQTFSVATPLINGFGLSIADARPIMSGYSSRREPPWSHGELEHKLQDADKLADDKPRGYLRDRSNKWSDKPPAHITALADTPFVFPGQEVESAEPAGDDTESQESFCARNSDASARESDEQSRNKETFPRFMNCHLASPSRGDPAESKEQKPIAFPISIEAIRTKLVNLTNRWPKAVQKQLFVKGLDGLPRYLDSKNKLMAGIQSHSQIHWENGKGFVKQEELFEHLREVSEQFEPVQCLPHHPPLGNAFYMTPDLPEPGNWLNEFVDLFCPYTPLDRDLIKVAILTPFWGGPPGQRPSFFITGPDEDRDRKGRGVGKTILVDMLGQLLGGYIDVTAKDKIEDVKTRILSSSASHYRLARIDKIKSSHFTHAELEALITSTTISGRRLYEGEGFKENRFTWFMTGNAAHFSKDLAERCCLIKLARPTDERFEWGENVSAMLQDHRLDIIAALASDRPSSLEPQRRWTTWQRAVLDKVDRAGEASMKSSSVRRISTPRKRKPGSSGITSSPSSVVPSTIPKSLTSRSSRAPLRNGWVRLLMSDVRSLSRQFTSSACRFQSCGSRKERRISAALPGEEQRRMKKLHGNS